MAKRYPSHVRVAVTKEIIEAAHCRDPNKCMIKIAVAHALTELQGEGTFRIKVDATGVTITRRSDYREKAFLPAPFAKNMLRFDRKEDVRPFVGTLKFVKTGRIEKRSEEEIEKNRQRVSACRARRIAAGIPEPKKTLRSVGLADRV